MVLSLIPKLINSAKFLLFYLFTLQSIGLHNAMSSRIIMCMTAIIMYIFAISLYNLHQYLSVYKRKCVIKRNFNEEELANSAIIVTEIGDKLRHKFRFLLLAIFSVLYL